MKDFFPCGKYLHSLGAPQFSPTHSISAELTCNPQKVLYLQQRNRKLCLSRDFIQIPSQRVTVPTEGYEEVVLILSSINTTLSLEVGIPCTTKDASAHKNHLCLYAR